MHEAKMTTNKELQITNRNFLHDTLVKWNTDTMIASMYHRVMNKEAKLDKRMHNVDVLIYILGRPNFYRAQCTGSEEDPEVKEPALLVLNGWLHKKFRNLGYEQVFSNNYEL